MQTPRATYRFQFNEHFQLKDALALVPFLHELGISHIYASPLFRACAHSNHGYDVCDFSQLNPELGSDADLETLVAVLRENKMGLVLDVVPNHMGVGTSENSWWWDVLKNGKTSRYASHFDINWEPPDESLREKLLLPVLGENYQRVLQKGDLKIEEESDGYVLRYGEHRFPLASNTLPKTLILDEINSSPVVLDELIGMQNYRLAFWGEGDSRLNYRRFFAISTLAGLRVEDEHVFAMVHPLLRRWIERGWVDGVRVDHPDGLREPDKYMYRLRALAPDQWIVVEKILQPHEHLPETWPVQGTTGYDFLNQVNGLFVNSLGEAALTDLYAEFTGESTDVAVLVQEKKRLILDSLFTTEVNHLVGLLLQIAEQRCPQMNYSREHLRDALMELAASFPVYRTYVSAEKRLHHESDVRFIDHAVAKACAMNPQLPPGIIELLRDLLHLHFLGNTESEFIARFQQLTGPVMAKGVEDTLFYCFNRFISLNEVGGDPAKFGISAEEFHSFCLHQQTHWPHTMLASSTHDTKRSEDVRARLNLLSEIPREWRQAVLRWSKINERYHERHFPDRNAEYLFYQTLVGTWPVPFGRISAYMEKATCEAKQHTDWNDRNLEYDSALRQFINAALADESFIADLEQFVGRLRAAGQINSLAQTLVKLTAPGVPDIYQGNEIWDFSLVDPDNRRPVDFKLRQRLLYEAMHLEAESIWARRDEGLPKLWMIQKTLALRAQHHGIFNDAFEPMIARGERANHLIAFVRAGRFLTAIPRFVLELNGNWADTSLELPPGVWNNEFTGEAHRGETLASDLFKNFPVTLLVKTEGK